MGCTLMPCHRLYRWLLIKKGESMPPRPIPKFKPKEQPRLLADDIIAIVAKQAKLNQEDVKACFKAYEEFIEYMLKDKNRQRDLEISMPYLGKIVFKNIKGKKKSTYKIPLDIGNGVMELTEMEIKEDRPNYQKLKFKFRPTLDKILKESSSIYE